MLYGLILSYKVIRLLIIRGTFKALTHYNMDHGKFFIVLELELLYMLG